MPVVVDLVGVLALALLLAVAFVHPRGRWELAAGLGAVAVVWAVGAIDLAESAEQAQSLLLVVLFLAAILVVADTCAAEGLFIALGGLVRRSSRGSPRRLLLLVFVLGALVTAVLSLDATVVLLTPVVAAAAFGTTVRSAGVHACIRLANSGSLLLPVSNLTNLLALPHLDIGFTTWLLVMTPVWVAVLVVEYVGLLVVFPGARASTTARSSTTQSTTARSSTPVTVPLPVVPTVALGLMLAGFAVGSALGVEPFWVAGVTAVFLSARGLLRSITDPGRLLAALHLPFVGFVLCLGVVVAALDDSFLGRLVAGLVPSSAGLTGLLLVAVLATVLANVVNNLPATLMLVPLVASLGPEAVLAALIGLNVGSGVTYPGSLANLLWRRTLRRHGRPADTLTFHRHALVATPVAVSVGVLVLWAWTNWLPLL